MMENDRKRNNKHLLKYIVGFYGFYMRKYWVSTICESGHYTALVINVILSGVKLAVLHDEGVCDTADLSSQFYLTEEDVGLNRAVQCQNKLKSLNPYVTVKYFTENLTEKVISKFKVVVLTNSSLEEQFQIAEWTRKYNVALIIADTRGLFAQVFCDFGEKFTVLDDNGENPQTALIHDISCDNEGVVTCVEDTPHGLQNGDYVKFSEVQGMTELHFAEPQKIKVLGPFKFSIGSTTNYTKYTSGGIVTQVKVPKVIQFKPLRKSIKQPEFLVTDFGKRDYRPLQLHLAFLTLHEFIDQYKRIPKPWNATDSKYFVNLAKVLNVSHTEKVIIDHKLFETFSNIAAGNLGPINSFVGGVVAQEIIKAVTGKFMPIHQWMYFDALECLPDGFKLSEEECANRGSRYDGQIKVFGKSFQKRISEQRYFVVGAGAIGCELLKNFAMIGVGASEKGKVFVTDMDFITESNLNSQFLFRASDVNRSKSVIASREVLKMNPSMNISGHDNKVGVETNKIYDVEFFTNLDGIASALDNIEGRIFVDQKCILHGKPLLESGIMGTKGSVQVIVPFLTESYQSSKDPLEKKIPPYTVKTFPYQIEHVIQWAQNLFHDIFVEIPKNTIQYLQDHHFIRKIRILPSSQQLELLIKIKKCLVDDYPLSFEYCVTWALQLFQELYNFNIHILISQFPQDHQTNTGKPFWSSQKRFPTPQIFSVQNQLHLDFIVAAANLRATVYGITQVRCRNRIAEMVANMNIPQNPPPAININESQQLEELLKDFSEQNIPRKFITPLNFDVDDDKNFQVDFILAASNLRALNYNIPPTDRLKCKHIAGKIIPTIVTTSSVVAGLACIELYKLVQGFKTCKNFKNRFVNLALPVFVFSEPVAAVRDSSV